MHLLTNQITAHHISVHDLTDLPDPEPEEDFDEDIYQCRVVGTNEYIDDSFAPADIFFFTPPAGSSDPDGHPSQLNVVTVVAPCEDHDEDTLLHNHPNLVLRGFGFLGLLHGIPQIVSLIVFRQCAANKLKTEIPDLTGRDDGQKTSAPRGSQAA
eukprot:COSAG01_NODE_6025_length_3894_cov_71.310408_4_plen_155_part_00